MMGKQLLIIIYINTKITKSIGLTFKKNEFKVKIVKDMINTISLILLWTWEIISTNLSKKKLFDEVYLKRTQQPKKILEALNESLVIDCLDGLVRQKQYKVFKISMIK